MDTFDEERFAGDYEVSGADATAYLAGGDPVTELEFRAQVGE